VLEFAERALLGGSVATNAPPSLNLNAFSIVAQ
jgi:hypothetical protein